MSAKKGQADEMFIRAAWDSIRDAEKEFNVHMHVSVLATQRMGVLQVTIAVRRPLAYPTDPSIVRVVGEFPNSTSGTLAAFLYAQITKAYHCVESWHTDQEKREAARQA